MTKSNETAPKTPGWYWLRKSNDSSWSVIRFIYDQGLLCGCDPFLSGRYSIPLSDPLWDGCEWIGPITPDDAAELARLKAARDVAIFAKGNAIVGNIDLSRLRAAGNRLVDAAKEAACALDGEANYQLRVRLCDAIAEWLMTT